jgi:acetyl-CoA acetyltransferase
MHGGRMGVRAPRRLMSRAVAIAGVGLHGFGRFEQQSVVDLGRHAVRAALESAGIGPGGFQAAFCGTVYSGVAAGHRVLSSLGLSGVPIVNVEAGCASGGAALRLGVSAIRSGECDTVLVFGMEKMPRGVIDSSFFEPWQKEAGLNPAPAFFALRARRLMRDSGVTLAHLARVSVKNHENGVVNPYAMYRKAMSAQAVLESPIVCEPLRLFMLCSPNEGAAAVVLRRNAKSGDVTIAAAALRSHMPGRVLGEHTPLCGTLNDGVPSPTELAAREAYEAAGVGPEDLDLAEVQDTDSGRELLSYEELLFCDRGGAAAWLDEGAPERHGRLPVNVSGGLLSKGEPLGASALAQVVEMVWQLRGEAGARQIDGARLGLCHTVGRGANACVIIVTR